MDDLADYLNSLFEHFDFDNLPLDLNDLDLDNLQQLLAGNGIDLSSFSDDELEGLADFLGSKIGLGSDLADVSQFLPESWAHNILSSDQSWEDVIESISGWQSAGETVQREMLLNTIDEYSSGYFQDLQSGEDISPLEHQIGSNLVSHLRQSNISFKGIDKLLSLNSYNVQAITSKVADLAAELPETAITEKTLQSVFEVFLKALKIK